jgi:undecaprenyl pyrophosphate synthase
VVHDDATDMYAVNYGSMAAVFVEAVKELSAQVSELKARVDALTA